MIQMAKVLTGFTNTITDINLYNIIQYGHRTKTSPNNASTPNILLIPL